jgi:hypothetical protein
MGVLTASQYSTAMGKATTLILSLGPSGITTALNNLMTVAGNNLTPFFNQMVTYTAKCEFFKEIFTLY